MFVCHLKKTPLSKMNIDDLVKSKKSRLFTGVFSIWCLVFRIEEFRDSGIEGL